MAAAVTTTDHDEIRRWVERHKGRPAHVRATGDGDGIGVLRIDFQEPDEGLEELSWDEWFEAFEANGLALLHTEDTRFNKLVRREG